MKRGGYSKLIEVGIYAIAMAFLEAVFVVYLRNATFQNSSFIYRIELVREAATIIMLAIIGILAGRERYERVAFFMYAFAIWDIFYYVFLKVLIKWPASLLAWDTLFLIPVKWMGPVLAPIMVSATMIVLALIIEDFELKRKKVYFQLKEEMLLVIGSLIILFTFVYDYSKLLIEGGFKLSSLQMQQILASYIPSAYNWPLFILGEIIMLSGIIMFYRRYKKPKK
jgi:hypothetical protein